MTSPLPLIAQLSMGLALGTLAGAWHFMSLRWNWPLFAEGRAAAALALQLARFALTGALLFLLAHVGALALLAGMAGFLLARAIVMRRHGGQP
ncbi:MAG: ATP synthase subunit I [Paraburkholderia sp.]|jgi:F1F0 ATPase subunit 2|uniref:N-ATPase subunit AtpR n=1 Tax=Paraburkholderia sp. TaxID=1926495 RepID=UPI003C425E67